MARRPFLFYSPGTREFPFREIWVIHSPKKYLHFFCHFCIALFLAIWMPASRFVKRDWEACCLCFDLSNLLSGYVQRVLKRSRDHLRRLHNEMSNSFYYTTFWLHFRRLHFSFLSAIHESLLKDTTPK